MKAIVDLDAALGDTRRLWADWVAASAGVLAVDAATLPTDRVAAAALLDAGGGNWRVLLERFAEDRAPVYLRPAHDASAALRRLARGGARIVVVTDAPRELAAVAAAHLGLTRRIEALEAGAGAHEAARARLGDDATVVSSRSQLVGLVGP